RHDPPRPRDDPRHLRPAGDRDGRDRQPCRGADRLVGGEGRRAHRGAGAGGLRGAGRPHRRGVVPPGQYRRRPRLLG
ncbi:MAG: hypothetical protein F4092_05845, partial [Rhodospirillaceae bacterium]|nr:hypothetical protein [Rhodospirillaceae bacterium]